MIFVDSSAWFAVVNRNDRYHERAKSILSARPDLLTSELVVVETWLLTNSRIDFLTAQRFLRLIGETECKILWSNEHDWVRGDGVSAQYPDQTFSIVDRTSFAIMERLGITEAVSFDDDFVVYRYGPNRSKAFNIIR